MQTILRGIILFVFILMSMGLAQASDERVEFIGHYLHIVSETANEL